MRIGFDAKRVFHNFRGLGNYSRTLLESLQKYYPENEYLLYTPPIKDNRGIEWQKKYDSFKVKTPQSILSKQFATLWRSLLLSKVIDNDNIEIYHGLSHELPPGIDKLKTKSVVTIHDLIFIRFPQFFPWIDRQVYLKKFTHSCESADLVVAICEQTKRDIIEFLGIPEEKIRVVYQSVGPKFYNMIPEEKIEKVLSAHDVSGKFILYVGALEERKNALSVVQAFARIKDHCKENLVLIGRGKEYKEKIQRTITELGMHDRVFILDNVTTEELPSFYRAATVFCYPSFFEGFGIPIAESLFCETPVITSEGSCFPEAGGENSIYIDPNSVESIANALSKVLSDEDLQQTMARKGRAFVEKFHWRNTSKNMMEIYSELLGLHKDYK